MKTATLFLAALAAGVTLTACGTSDADSADTTAVPYTTPEQQVIDALADDGVDAKKASAIYQNTATTCGQLDQFAGNYDVTTPMVDSLIALNGMALLGQPDPITGGRDDLAEWVTHEATTIVCPQHAADKYLPPFD